MLEDLFHGRSELLADLGVLVAVEDAPGLQRRLLKHLVLNLPVDISSASFDVERVPLSAALGAHDHVACLVLVSLERCWIFLELQVPKFLLLLALRVRVEDLQQVSAFTDLSVCVGVHYLSEVFHESKVCSHRISETCHLTEFWNEGDFNSSSAIFVDEQRLSWISDILVVSGLVVVFVGNLNLSQQNIHHLPEFQICRRWSRDSCRIRLCQPCKSSGCI